MKTVYLAGPLFSLAEQEFNRNLAHALSEAIPGIDVVLPQERAKSLLQLPDGLLLVFRDCLEMVKLSDVVLAILEGPDVDSGTCVELGYALAAGKKILGVRTDLRASEDQGLNLMVSHSCTKLLRGSFDTIDALAKKVAEGLTSLLAEV